MTVPVSLRVKEVGAGHRKYKYADIESAKSTNMCLSQLFCICLIEDPKYLTQIVNSQ